MTPELSAAIARIRDECTTLDSCLETFWCSTEAETDNRLLAEGAIDANKRIRTLLSALEEAQAVRAKEPDYLYDPDDWEVTWPWREADTATDELRIGEWHLFSTLYIGPDKWAAHVAVTRDDAGDPDETEVRWFDSEADAKAAVLTPTGAQP